MPALRQAPALDVERWFLTNSDLALCDLLGRVVLLEAFQMMCPACVSHSLPQAQRVTEAFPAAEVAVIGLHTVFEHHAAMGPVSLGAFLHEYGIRFPVGIDRPSTGNDPRPSTMQTYQMRGTPTTILIDRQGRLRAHHFGRVTDLELGAQLSALLSEPVVDTGPPIGAHDAGSAVRCAEQGCPVSR